MTNIEKILSDHKAWLLDKSKGAQANLRDANLYGANLRGANLRDADLRGANLYEANLYGANLRDADLQGANLQGANLRGANLYEANLYGADLRDADLPLIGNMKEIRTLQIDRYTVVFTRDTMKIGCQQHSIAKWRNFSDTKISKMDSRALEWWAKWKDFIFLAIELSGIQGD